MKKWLIELGGWYGGAAILGAYGLVSFRIIQPEGYLYQLLNLSGAIGIIVVSAAKGVEQSVVLNTFWAVIALVALARLLLL